jgi:hypothetical protein
MAASASTDGWKPHAVREEIAPRSFTEQNAQGGLVLGLTSCGDDAVDGRWVREVPVAPGKTYSFAASWRARNGASPARSVLARLVLSIVVVHRAFNRRSMGGGSGPPRGSARLAAARRGAGRPDGKRGDSQACVGL